MSMKYPVIVVWSEVDEAFLAGIPQLAGCVAHGETQTEAVEALVDLADQWVATAKEKGWIIPKPKCSSDLEREHQLQLQRQQEEFSAALKAGVEQSLAKIVPGLVADLLKQFKVSAPDSFFELGRRPNPLRDLVGAEQE